MSIDRFVAAGLMFALVAVAGVPAAQAEHPDNPRGQIRAELSFGTSSYTDVDPVGNTTEAEALSIAPRFQFDYRVLESMQLWVDIPMAHVAITVDSPLVDASDDDFRIGNIGFGVRWVGELSEEMVFRAGVGFAAPTASADDLIAAAAYSATLGTHAMWSPWMYLWDRFSIVFDAELEARFGLFKLTADLGMAPLIPVGDLADANADVEFALQLAVSAAFANEFVEAGVTVAVVTWPSFDDNDGDAAQLSLQPYGRFRIGMGFVDVRLLLNLDDPYGFAFDEDRWWGLNVGGGVTFD